ncbi:hypothetical protein EMIT0324P_20798 [Pseudomonas chlororaphis]
MVSIAPHEKPGPVPGFLVSAPPSFALTTRAWMKLSLSNLHEATHLSAYPSGTDKVNYRSNPRCFPMKVSV